MPKEDTKVSFSIDKMELVEKEKIMETLTSWERKAAKTIALNLLRENLPLEMIARTTGLTVGQLQDLQAEAVSS